MTPTRDEIAALMALYSEGNATAMVLLARHLPFLASAYVAPDTGALAVAVVAMRDAAAQVCQQAATKDAAHLGEFINGHSTACSEMEDAILAIATPSPAAILAAALALPEVKAAKNEWQPIATSPFRVTVDLWCVSGYEEFARYDGGASVGELVSRRFRHPEYGWFGNQSNDGIPRGDLPDLMPIAWRYAVPDCPAELIAEVLRLPIDRDAALKAIAADPAAAERIARDAMKGGGE